LERYLPVNGMEETDEVIISGAKASTNIWGELLNKICHKLHVILHSRFYFLHFSNTLILTEQGSSTRHCKRFSYAVTFPSSKTLLHFFFLKPFFMGLFMPSKMTLASCTQSIVSAPPLTFKFQLCPWHFYTKACNGWLK